MLPDYLGRRIPFYPFRASVPACDVPVWVEHEDRIVSNRLHHQLVYSAALLEGVGKAHLGDGCGFAVGNQPQLEARHVADVFAPYRP